jgi:transcriptional/translational regulatory protein YebC/TACO1
MMEALEAGAEDFSAEEEYFEILASPEDFSAVREGLEKKGCEFLEAEVQMVPVTMTKLTDPDQLKFMEKLIDSLEDLDDVQNVYHNWEEEE